MPLITAEDLARNTIDSLLDGAGWQVFDANNANIHAEQGGVMCEFPPKQSHGFADYLSYVEGKAAGVIEAKKEGTTFSGVETQSAKYGELFKYHHHPHSTGKTE